MGSSNSVRNTTKYKPLVGCFEHPPKYTEPPKLFDDNRQARLQTSLDTLQSHYKVYISRGKGKLISEEFAMMALAILQQTRLVSNISSTNLTTHEIIAISEATLFNRVNVIKRNVTAVFNTVDRSIEWTPITVVNVRRAAPNYARRIRIAEYLNHLKHKASLDKIGQSQTVQLMRAELEIFFDITEVMDDSAVVRMCHELNGISLDKEPELCTSRRNKALNIGQKS
jgi:hypothetical protein